MRKRKPENAEKHRARQRRYLATPAGRAKYNARQALYRARRRAEELIDERL
jgi:hypothetical protein